MSATRARSIPRSAARCGNLGGLDVLVNAAGSWQPGVPGHITSDEIDFLLATNVKATILTNQAAHAVMRGNGGQIINFGSAEAVMGSPIAAVYAATEGCCSSLDPFGGQSVGRRADHRQCAGAGGARHRVRTGFGTSSGPDAAAFIDQQMKLSIPLGGKLGDPADDLGPVLVFLASDGARFITGQLIPG